jgi:DeoR family fructose operon transcriptional repressor
MTQDTLFVEERKMKILEFIEEHKKATVAQLCDRFKVSSATIRNDLKNLENAKLLIRTHGGAMVNTKTGLELNSHQKQVQNLEAKRRIAERAIDLIEDGDTIILDTGTTTLELARLVEKRKDITVVTNDLVIALLLEESSSANVMFMGGLLRRRFHCTITSGHAWDSVLSGLTVDKAFMGVNSLSIDKGATTPDIHQAETKREMISIAVKVILLCDSSKIERNSFAQFADLERIDTVITEKIRENEKKKFEERGIEIIVAG